MTRTYPVTTTDDFKSNIKTPGIDFGPLSIVAWNPETMILVVKVKGHKYWSGIGRTAYSPANMRVLKLTKNTGTGNGDYRAEELIEWETRKTEPKS